MGGSAQSADFRIRNSGADKPVMMPVTSRMMRPSPTFLIQQETEPTGSSLIVGMVLQVEGHRVLEAEFFGCPVQGGQGESLFLGRITGPVDDISFIPDEPDKLFRIYGPLNLSSRAARSENHF